MESCVSNALMGKYGTQLRRPANVNLATNGMAIFVRFLTNAKEIWSGTNNTKFVFVQRSITGVDILASPCLIAKMIKSGIKIFKNVSAPLASTLMEKNAYFVGMALLGIKKN